MHSRILRDTRPRSCHSSVKNFPSVSVILTYQEVDRSALLRCIASIVGDSKPVAITEIIIVDDGCSDVETSELLANLQSVKVIRNDKPEGRGNARMQGAAVAQGDIIVFVDGLVEMNVEWLSPLVQRLSKNPKSIVAPVLDVIDYQTLEYKASSNVLRGGLDWSLQYKWDDPRGQTNFDMEKPFKTPIQSGAVFAVRKDFFLSIGQYDTNVAASGIEDTELSLRVWMCGGQIETIPCSRVGLIQPKGAKLGVQHVPFNINLRGTKRVAEMWLDDYKRFFYAVRPSARMQPFTNLSSFRKMRAKRKCKSFKWFLSEVYPQLKPLVTDEIAYGSIKQKDNCIDVDVGQLPLIVKLRHCQERKDSQEWSWRKKGVIVSNGMCLTSDITNMKGFVMVQFCKDIPSQIWSRQGPHIVHQESKLCLDSTDGNLALKLSRCVRDRPSQEWSIFSELGEQSVGEPDFSFSDVDDVIFANT